MCKTKQHQKQKHGKNHGKTNVEKQTVQQLSENMPPRLKQHFTNETEKNLTALSKKIKERKHRLEAANMKTIQKIKQQLKTLKPLLKEKYQVETIGIFGSYTRGEQKRKSDLDIIVEFSEPNDIDLFKVIELKLFLEDELHVKIDLIEKDTIKPRLKDRILQETIQV